ncbi:MAG: hypothetical protein FJW23_16360 [Acidimicrobiia bacterium]|nr:hypothetical protein [Acidimicrobiia bacterium]
MEPPVVEDQVRRALARQGDRDARDLRLNVERLSWTPEQRLEANATFLRFHMAARPTGPFVTGA